MRQILEAVRQAILELADTIGEDEKYSEHFNEDSKIFEALMMVESELNRAA